MHNTLLFNTQFVNRGLSVPEALRATNHPCTCQHLYRVSTDRQSNATVPIHAVTVVTVTDLASIDSSITQKSSVRESRQKSPRNKHAEQVAMKETVNTRKTRHDNALKEGV